MSKILQCHSRGDRRYSPFFCRVRAFGVWDSIENHYQTAKVFVADGGELVWPKDWKEAKQFDKQFQRHVEFRLPNGIFAPVEYLVFGWYASLWLKYLDEHPDLVTEAKEYDDYVDIFKHNFPLCQADCLRLYCKQGREALLNVCKPFFAWLRKNT